MNAGLRYGLFLSAVMMPLILVGFHRNETLMALVWGVISVQLAVATWLVWSRTGLRYATAAMAEGAVTSAAFMILLLRGFNPLALENLVWFLPLLLAGPLLFWVESRKNPEKWRAWGEHMKDMSAFEMLRGRHIPDWRGGDGRRNAEM